MQAIILAGGLGTRLRGEVPNLPKSMAPICGHPFLKYLFDYWINQGVCEFILAVGYKYEFIKDYFGNQYQDAKISYVIEDYPLGTGGAFLFAAQKINKNSHFLLLNGDTYFEVPLSKLLQFATHRAADWCFSVFSSGDKGRYLGVDTDDGGKIITLASKNTSSECLVNGGVYLINSAVLNSIQSEHKQSFSLELDLFPLLLSGGFGMYAIKFDANFIDIGIPQDYKRAKKIIVKT